MRNIPMWIQRAIGIFVLLFIFLILGDDNLLGYDVQSWDADCKKIFIEAKYSSNSNGNFHFSRNAWLYAQSVKEKYFVHIWIQQAESPTIMEFHKLKDHVAKYEEISGEGDKWESVIITPKGRN